MVAMLYRIISSLSTDQVEDLLSQFETELMLQSQNGKFFSFRNLVFDVFQFLFILENLNGDEINKKCQFFNR